MYSRFQLAQKYLRYYVNASNGKGHGIHSPFVFDFVTNVLIDRRHFYAYDSIETLRKRLLQDKKILEVEDFGAGSALRSTNKRSIAAIATNAAKNEKLSKLLFRVVQYYKPNIILELGTSLGISSAYMAAANLEAAVITLEGAPEIAKAAKENHDCLGLTNTRVLTGSFDDILPGVLQQLETVDLAFIDGNHRFAPTVHYFEKIVSKSTSDSILILDDIHWSKEMEDAWTAIKQHEAVRATIDLFFIGIVFLRPDFKTPQHFAIRF